MFDPTKPVQTRDGKRAQILDFKPAINRGAQPIIAVVDFETHLGIEYFWSDGAWTRARQSELDLINVPETPEIKEVWVNIYKGCSVKARTREEADQDAIHLAPLGTDRVACVKLEYKEGQGL